MLGLRILVLLLLSTSAYFAKAGGPWLSGKGHGFVQFQTVLPAYQYSGLLMSHLRDVQGVNRYTYNADFGVYAEYGITKKLDLITTLPFKYVKTGEVTDQRYFDNLLDEGSLAGFSNYHLALKYGLVDSKVKVAVSLQTRWNTGKLDLDKGLATGYDANSFGIMAHIGRGSDKHYGFLELGYNVFTNGFSHMMDLNIEHGWKVKEAWFVAASLSGRFGLNNGDYNEPTLAQTGLYPNNQQWAAISLKASRDFKNGWGVNGALPLVPIYFKYVGFNGSISLGVFKKF